MSPTYPYPQGQLTHSMDLGLVEISEGTNAVPARLGRKEWWAKTPTLTPKRTFIIV
jgi:hypothetical protein